MVIDKKSKWTRSPSFRKYFATSFGISKVGNYIRLDFGDERVQFSKEDAANVSECQIITDINGFNTFLDLLNKYNENQIKKKYKK